MAVTMLHRYGFRIDPKHEGKGSARSTRKQPLHHELSGLISCCANAGFGC